MLSDQTKLIKILVADDHVLVRETLCERLQRENCLTVVGGVGSAEEAIRQTVQRQPDVLLMDIDMPGLDCFHAVKHLLALLPSLRVIFVSAHVRDNYIDKALRAGAIGYVTKDESAEKIVSAIQSVYEGNAFFSDSILKRIVFDQASPKLLDSGCVRFSTLTDREDEVLRYLATGYAKKQIAAIMHVSIKTVEKHTEHVMTKLELHDRVELARYAVREGLVEL